MLKTCGKKGRILLDISVIGMYFGMICNYTVVLSNYLHSGYDWFSSTNICNFPDVYNELECSELEKCRKNSNRVELYCMLVTSIIFLLESTFITNV
jgi:hypothetical protein